MCVCVLEKVNGAEGSGRIISVYFHIITQFCALRRGDAAAHFLFSPNEKRISLCNTITCSSLWHCVVACRQCTYLYLLRIGNRLHRIHRTTHDSLVHMLYPLWHVHSTHAPHIRLCAVERRALKFILIWVWQNIKRMNTAMAAANGKKSKRYSSI